MRALLSAALVALWAHSSIGFFFLSPGSHREASQNYYEIMTNCEREGGECVDVDFGTTDPPTPAPTPPPTPRPTTRAPPPPTPFTQPPFFHWFPFWPTANPFVPYNVPVPAPLPMTPAPPPPTPAPTTRQTTHAPVPPVQPTNTPTGTPAPPAKRARKVGGKRGNRRNKNNGEQEREVRRRRQINPWDQLYSECSGGWEFDLGCEAKGGNVCCYSSNSGSSTK